MKAQAGKINSMTFLAFGGSDTVARNLTSNYAFKPSAEQALRMNRGISCRAGLMRRWTSEAVADRGRALRWKGRICLGMNLS